MTDKVRESYEDYLKTIYLISRNKKGGWVSNSEIARFLKVKPSSVTDMLYKLKNEGYILWAPRKALRLSKEGKTVATRVIKSYNELTHFFQNILQLTNTSEVKTMSCMIEHHLTPNVIASLEEFNRDYS